MDRPSPTKANRALSPFVLVGNPRNAETSQSNEPIPIRLGMTPPFDSTVAYCWLSDWFGYAIMYVGTAEYLTAFILFRHSISCILFGRLFDTLFCFVSTTPYERLFS